MTDESSPTATDRYVLSISTIESDFASADGSIVAGFVGIVRGTAIDRAYDSSPEIVTGVLDDVRHFEAVVGWPSDAGADAFVFRFQTFDLEAGEHTVHVVAGSRDGSSHAWSAKQTFTLLPTESVIPKATYATTWACASIDWADRAPTVIAAIADVRRIPRGEVVNVRGWAIDTIARNSVGDAYLIIDQTNAIRLECRQWRSDVSAAFGYTDVDAAYCGFVGSIATDMLEPGLHLAQCFVIAKTYSETYRTDAVLMFEVVSQAEFGP